MLLGQQGDHRQRLVLHEGRALLVRELVLVRVGLDGDDERELLLLSVVFRLLCALLFLLPRLFLQLLFLLQQGTLQFVERCFDRPLYFILYY